MERENLYRLLYKTGDTIKILCEGSEDFCNTKRLEYSISTYNSECLKVERIKSEERKTGTLLTTYRKEIGQVITIFALGIIGWLFEKKKEVK